MVHGYAGDALDGVREFMGDPDSIVEFAEDCEILVTHLAPITRSMLKRLGRLKLIAVSRGGPVNIDLAAAREKGVAVVNTPGRNASAVAEIKLGMNLAQTRLILEGRSSLRARDSRSDLYSDELYGYWA